jgi:hypothetical protein
MQQTLIITLISIICISCGQNATKQKELELKGKELEIRDRELRLREKDSIADIKIKKADKPELIYNIEKHGDIKFFIDDLAKAISLDDKSAVARMTYFPFKDGFREWLTGGIEVPKNIPDLTCNNEKQFLDKYSRIFLPGVKKEIESKSYRGYDYSAEEFSGDIIESGEFVINGEDYINDRQYSIAIKKINGKFKLHRMVWSS